LEIFNTRDPLGQAAMFVTALWPVLIGVGRAQTACDDGKPVRIEDLSELKAASGEAGLMGDSFKRRFAVVRRRSDFQRRLLFAAEYRFGFSGIPVSE